jgi:hypothetical protein
MSRNSVTPSFIRDAKSSSQKEMVIKLGYEMVKVIDDGGLRLSFLGQSPNLLIPPVLSLEVTQPANTFLVLTIQG